MDKGSKESSPPHNLGRNQVNTYAVRITMLIADIKDDIMDPVMQCITLPSHLSFSQKKLVSFVTEIHSTTIDFLTPSYSQAVNKSPTHYPCDSARTFRVILFSIHNDEWKSFQCHHQTALRSYALSWKPCQGDSLNLPDHRIHKDGDGDASFQLKSDSLPHAHAQTTKTYYKHQDSRIMKAQELKTKTSAQTLIYKIFLQRYQVYQGRLLASFQDDAKYEHTKSKDNDKGSRSKITKHEGTSLQRRQRQRSQELNDKSNLIDLIRRKSSQMNFTSGEISSLISLNYGSCDAIVGMDWLSKRKFVMVCHEKVVRILLEGDEIRRVHDERTQGVVKTLMNTEFRVDLVPGATPVAKSPYRLAPSEMQELSEQLQELQDEGFIRPSHFPWGAPVVLLRREQWSLFEVRIGITEEGEVTYLRFITKFSKIVKPLTFLTERNQKKGEEKRRVRAMFMTIQTSVHGQDIMLPLSETSKVENAPAEMRDLDQQMEKRADDGCTLWIVYEFCYYQLSIRCAPFEALYERKCTSPVLWAEIGESSLIRPELVQDTTDKVVLIKEKLKAARDRQKSCADNRRKPLEFEVGDRVMLKVSPWKGVIRFGKKVSNLKNNGLGMQAHEPLDEIKVDKTFCFVKEPIENSDREVKRLKCSRMVVVTFIWSFEARSLGLQAKLLAVRYRVKVCWNSKRGPEFTWEREDFMKSKYPQLFVDRADESTNLISGRDFLKEGIL
ncbi:hypothetical protein Tco_1202829 [Tanacetum coccineum]